jgi:hypothetical protein
MPIDKRGASRELKLAFVTMLRVLYRLFALCLALSWVPATAHCQIETLGLEIASCADSCHDKGSPEASHDGCSLVEDGLYKAATQTAKLAPVALHCVCLISLYVFVPEPATGPAWASVALGADRDWVPSWHFLRRAAAPAHAPDSLVA